MYIQYSIVIFGVVCHDPFRKVKANRNIILYCTININRTLHAIESYIQNMIV